MSKKSFFVIFVFIFIFSLFSFYSVVLAQGSCTADFQVNRCVLVFNNCKDGYSPIVTGPEVIGTTLKCYCNCESGIRNPALTGTLSRLSGAEFLSKLISFGISIGFTIAAVVFFFMFISGGIRWITSSGDKTRVETARSQITHALIGLLLTFALYVILGLIEDFFGISLRQFNLPKLTD